MKRLLSLTGLSSLALLILTPLTAMAQATPFWQLNISQPANQTSHSFNLQYTVLATSSATFTVKLCTVSDTTCATPAVIQDTNVDPNATNGNSGAFSVTVPSDGDYGYFVKATRDTSADPAQQTNTVTVHVDATPPAAPIYNGKTISGNSYILNATAPSSSDVSRLEFYTSTNTSFQADSVSRIGSVVVTPNQVVSFSYTAPDSSIRYFAVRAFDTSNNGSVAVGDQNVVVSVPLANSTTSATTGGQAVSGVSTTTKPSGQTSSINTSTPGATAATGVLGAKTANNNFRNWALAIGAGVIVTAIVVFRAVSSPDSILKRKK
jgi:hypothetical protein